MTAGGASRPGVAGRAAAFADALPAMTDDAEAGRPMSPWVERFGVVCTPVADAVRLHWTLLDLALDAVG